MIRFVKTKKGYQEYGPPRYYDKLYEKIYGSDAFLKLKKDRFQKNKNFFLDEDESYDRLLVEEIIKMKDVEKLFRHLEDGID